jgi:hypothetical protein
MFSDRAVQTCPGRAFPPAQLSRYMGEQALFDASENFINLSQILLNCYHRVSTGGGYRHQYEIGSRGGISTFNDDPWPKSHAHGKRLAGRITVGSLPLAILDNPVQRAAFEPNVRHRILIPQRRSIARVE